MEIIIFKAYLRVRKLTQGLPKRTNSPIHWHPGCFCFPKRWEYTVRQEVGQSELCLALCLISYSCVKKEFAFMIVAWSDYFESLCTPVR